MATAEITRRPIGQILLDGGFIAHQDLELALEVQKHSNELLGQVLVNMGILDKADLDAALSIQDHLSSLDAAVQSAAGIRKMLGSLLLLTGKITTEQLDFALEEQKITGEKLGDLLVRLGLLTEAEITSVLRFQQHQEAGGSLPSPLRLGELLIASGYITRQQLSAALAKQQQSSRKLGEVLVAEGYVHPHQIKHGIYLQRRLLRAVLVAVVSLAGLSMPGCGSGGGAAAPYPAGQTTNVTASTSGNQTTANLIATNYLQIAASNYQFARLPNFYYSTDNQHFWSIQANVAQSVADSNSRSVIRIDIPKNGSQLPSLNRTFTFDAGSSADRFPGEFFILDGQQSTRKKVESGSITFSADSVMSEHVSGSFDVVFVDNDIGVMPAPRYFLKGVFSFRMGGYGPAV